MAAGACGLAAAALALLVPVVAAWGEPAYSHVAQYISELGATDSAHPSLVAAAGFAPIGLLVLAFLALASGVLPCTRLVGAGLVGLGAVGVGYLVAAVFPCDAGCPSAGSLSQSIHNLFGFLEYAGAVAGLLALGAALLRPLAWRPLARGCFVAAGLVALGFLAMLAPGLESVRGLSQRLAEGAIFAWLAFASACLLRVGRKAEA